MESDCLNITFSVHITMQCEYYRATNVNMRQGDDCQLSSVYAAMVLSCYKIV